MEVKEALKTLWQTAEFKEWQSSNPKSFLAHCFIMPDESLKGEWQIGYFDPNTELMTSLFLNFNAGKTEVIISPETEILKKEGHKVSELDLNKVKIEYTPAVNTARDLMKKEYPKDSAIKRIVILQNIEKTLWNITFMTQTFSTINIKIDAATGSIIKHDKQSLLGFSK